MPQEMVPGGESAVIVTTKWSNDNEVVDCSVFSLMRRCLFNSMIFDGPLPLEKLTI